MRIDEFNFFFAAAPEGAAAEPDLVEELGDEEIDEMGLTKRLLMLILMCNVLLAMLVS